MEFTNAIPFASPGVILTVAFLSFFFFFPLRATTHGQEKKKALWLPSGLAA